MIYVRKMYYTKKTDYMQKPIVIVGNKLDLQKSPSTINRSTHLKDRAESVLTKYMVRIDR